jgi:ZIP family zinc transporter
VTKALLYGLATALPLVLGAVIGLRFQVPRPLLAALLAFGAGTMISAASEELFTPAFEEVGSLQAGGALLAGALTYVVGAHLLDRRFGVAAVGFGLMLANVLDGIPENAALGVSLSEGGTVALLVAIIIGNTPEAIASTAFASMSLKGEETPRKILVPWVITAAVLVLVTVATYRGGEAISKTQVATIQAFAGGATIAVLADTLMPEAYRDGGWWVGLATAMGFFVAYVIGG